MAVGAGKKRAELFGPAIDPENTTAANVIRERPTESKRALRQNYLTWLDRYRKALLDAKPETITQLFTKYTWEELRDLLKTECVEDSGRRFYESDQNLARSKVFGVWEDTQAAEFVTGALFKVP